MSAAVALNDVEFNARYTTKALTKAADYFGDHAKRRMPVRPDEMAADLLASVLGSLIGKPDPQPLPDLPPVGDMPAQKPATPGGAIRSLPEAKSLLKARGYRRVSDSVAHVYSAFLLFPDTEWSAAELGDRLGLPKKDRVNVSACIYSLLDRKCVVEGEKPARYKLAPGI